MNHEGIVKDYYSNVQLINEISCGITKLGKNEQTVSICDLGSADEFHIGGRQASVDFLGQLNIIKSSILVISIILKIYKN